MLSVLIHARDLDLPYLALAILGHLGAHYLMADGAEHADAAESDADAACDGGANEGREGGASKGVGRSTAPCGCLPLPPHLRSFLAAEAVLPTVDGRWVSSLSAGHLLLYDPVLAVAATADAHDLTAAAADTFSWPGSASRANGPEDTGATGVGAGPGVGLVDMDVESVALILQAASAQGLPLGIVGYPLGHTLTLTLARLGSQAQEVGVAPTQALHGGEAATAATAQKPWEPAQDHLIAAPAPPLAPGGLAAPEGGQVQQQLSARQAAGLCALMAALGAHLLGDQVTKRAMVWVQGGGSGSGSSSAPAPGSFQPGWVCGAVRGWPVPRLVDQLGAMMPYVQRYLRANHPAQWQSLCLGQEREEGRSLGQGEGRMQEKGEGRVSGGMAAKLQALRVVGGRRLAVQLMLDSLELATQVCGSHGREGGEGGGVRSQGLSLGWQEGIGCVYVCEGSGGWEAQDASIVMQALLTRGCATHTRVPPSHVGAPLTPGCPPHTWVPPSQAGAPLTSGCPPHTRVPPSHAGAPLTRGCPPHTRVHPSPLGAPLTRGCPPHMWVPPPHAGAPLTRGCAPPALCACAAPQPQRVYSLLETLPMPVTASSAGCVSTMLWVHTSEEEEEEEGQEGLTPHMMLQVALEFSR